MAALIAVPAFAGDGAPLPLEPPDNARPLWTARGAEGPPAPRGKATRSASRPADEGKRDADGLIWRPSAKTSLRTGGSSTSGALIESGQTDAAIRPVQWQAADPADDPFGDRAAQAPGAPSLPMDLDPPAGPFDDPPGGFEPSQPTPLEPAPLPPPRGADPYGPDSRDGELRLAPFKKSDICDDDCFAPRKGIRLIDLNISPPLEPDQPVPFEDFDTNGNRIIDADERASVEAHLAERRERYLQSYGSQSHDWTDADGNLLANGRLIDFRDGRVIVESDSGERVAIPHKLLGEQSLCEVSTLWRLPKECRLGGGKFAARCWTPLSFTWTASALCHKPLYFEDIHLERYGHTAPAGLQPLISGAHFFGSIVTLPYKIGISPPTECQYVLGHYRPGSCAPWLIDPLPLSLRGAALQTGAVAVGVVAFP